MCDLIDPLARRICYNEIVWEPKLNLSNHRANGQSIDPSGLPTGPGPAAAKGRFRV